MKLVAPTVWGSVSECPQRHFVEADHDPTPQRIAGTIFHAFAEAYLSHLIGNQMQQDPEEADLLWGPHNEHPDWDKLDSKWQSEVSTWVREFVAAFKLPPFENNGALWVKEGFVELDILLGDIGYVSKREHATAQIRLDVILVLVTGDKPRKVDLLIIDFKTGEEHIGTEGTWLKPGHIEQTRSTSMPKDLQGRWQVIAAAAKFEKVKRIKFAHWYVRTGQYAETKWIPVDKGDEAVKRECAPEGEITEAHREYNAELAREEHAARPNRHCPLCSLNDNGCPYQTDQEDVAQDILADRNPPEPVDLDDVRPVRRELRDHDEVVEWILMKTDSGRQKWVVLRETGANDEELLAAIKGSLGTGGAANVDGYDYEARGGDKLWFGSIGMSNRKPDLTGKPLLEIVRRVTGVKEGPGVSRDEILHRALHGMEGAEERWAERCKTGLDNADLNEALGYEWKGGPSHLGHEFSYTAKGTKRPAFWFGETNPHTRKADLAGVELLDAVRRATGVPMPVDPRLAGGTETPPPASATGRISGQDQGAFINMLTARAKVYGYRLGRTGSGLIDVIKTGLEASYVSLLDAADHTKLDDKDPQGLLAKRAVEEMAEIGREWGMALVPPEGSVFMLERIEEVTPISDPELKSIKEIESLPEKEACSWCGVFHEGGPENCETSTDAAEVLEANGMPARAAEMRSATFQPKTPELEKQLDDAENAITTPATPAAPEPETTVAEDNAPEVSLKLRRVDRTENLLWKILLAGPPKVGKTRSVLDAFCEAASTDISKCLIVDVEDGTRFYGKEWAFARPMEKGWDPKDPEKERVPTHPATVVKVIKHYINNLPKGYDTLVLDSITVILQKIELYWVGIFMNRDVSSPGYKVDFLKLQPDQRAVINREVRQLFDDLRAANHNVVLVSHVAPKYVKAGRMFEQDGERIDAGRDSEYEFDTVVQIERDNDHSLWARTLGDRSDRLPETNGIRRWQWTQDALKKAIRGEAVDIETEAQAEPLPLVPVEPSVGVDDTPPAPSKTIAEAAGDALAAADEPTPEEAPGEVSTPASDATDSTTPSPSDNGTAATVPTSVVPTPFDPEAHAKLLVEQGVVRVIADAFDGDLADAKPELTPEEWLSLPDGVKSDAALPELVRTEGGVTEDQVREIVYWMKKNWKGDEPDDKRKRLEGIRGVIRKVTGNPELNSTKQLTEDQARYVAKYLAMTPF